jgi:hypothetical protein
LSELTPGATREWEILLAASSPNPAQDALVRLRSLLQTQIDWDALLRLADHHGTASLFFNNLAHLEDCVPSQVFTSLRQRSETNVHKSLFLTRELIRILDCLESLGIEVIPYKGVVLSETLYEDIALRQGGDIDLFVRKEDVGRIKNAVRELGFTPRLAIPAAAERDYIAAGYEFTFDSAAGRNLLELQWALQPRFYAVDYDMSGLFQRAMTASVGGRNMKTLSPEDLFLVLSVHAAKHVWGRLIWLCDIAQILKMPNLNWEWIQSQAQELGIERILFITLLLTNRFLETEIPAALARAIERDRAALRFANNIAAYVVQGVSYENEQISYFTLMMRLRERRSDQMRFLTRLMFTPGPGEWEAVHLPKPLFPLYRLVRLGRLAARFARG